MFDKTKDYRSLLVKKTLAFSTLTIVLIASLLLPTPAAAVPQPPHAFRGAVTVGSAAAADNLTVTAVIAGVTFPYSVSVNTSGGRYGDSPNLLKVPADDPDTTTKEGGVAGDTVIFYIQGGSANETYTFAVGGVTTLNLSISALPTLAAPTNVLWTSAATDNTPTFTWNAVSGAASYQVRRDGSTFTDVGNVLTYTFSTVSDGSHSFEVRAVDSGGVAGASSDLLAFTIDTTPPVVTITALTPDPTTDTTPTFTGTATDATSNITSVQYRVDGGSWIEATASDGTFNSASEGYTFTTSALAVGAHTVEVRATDAAGNTTLSANYASDTFTIQAVAVAVAVVPAAPAAPTAAELEALPAAEAAARVEATTTEAAAQVIEQVTTAKAADIIEQVTTAKAAGIIEQVTTAKAAGIIEQVTTAKAAGIIEQVTTAKAADIIEQVTTAKAADIIEQVTTAKAADIIEQVTTAKAAGIIEQVTTAKAVDIVQGVTTAKAAGILEGVTVAKAAAIMEGLTTQKLTDTIPAMSEASLTARLPGLTPEKLYSIDPKVLFNSLPNAPTEQLLSEEPPKPPAEAGPPVAVFTTPSGATYLAVRTWANEWVVVMATPPPVGQLLIKTKRALENVETTVEVLEEQPTDIAVGLPAGQIARAYLNISFKNATPEDIDVGHMTLKMEQAWLTQNSIHKWSVALSRYDPDLKQWLSLPTKRVKEDASYVYYTVVITRFSTFAVSGSQTLPPLNFGVSNLSLNPTEAKTGEPITISANITNLADSAGTYVATLWIDNTIETGKNVALTVGETAKVSFTVTRNVEGSYNVRLDRLFGSFSVTKAPPVEKPPVEKPPVEKPPVEKPPVEKPPVEKPPVEKPPVEKPPVEKPPVEVPPVEKPPVEVPPVEVPPVEVPPINWGLISGGIIAGVIIIGVIIWLVVRRRRI